MCSEATVWGALSLLNDFPHALLWGLSPFNPLGFPCGSAGKESACNVGDLGSIPGLGRSPGEGNGHPLQYSGLKNSMDYIVHGVAKSWTWLSDFHIVNLLFNVYFSYLIYILLKHIWSIYSTFKRILPMNKKYQASLGYSSTFLRVAESASKDAW